MKGATDLDKQWESRPCRCDCPGMGIFRSRHLGCQGAEPNFRKAARGEVGKVQARLTLEEGVSEHWASRGRSSRNLAEGERRPRRVAGEREGISRQGPRPGCGCQGSWWLGHPHPMVFGPDKPITWEGEDKDHLAKQDCISIIPSHLGGMGMRGNSPERAQPGPKPALLAPTPLLLLLPLAAFLRTGVSCGERGSAVTGRDSSRAWQGEARLLSAPFLSVSPGQAPIGSKRLLLLSLFLKPRLRVEINQKVVGRIK